MDVLLWVLGPSPGRTAVGSQAAATALHEARARLSRAERSRRVADIDQAVLAGDRAVHACAAGTQEHFEALVLNADIRGLRYEAAGHPADLAVCVEMRGDLLTLARSRRPELVPNLVFAFTYASLELGLRTGDQRSVELALAGAQELHDLGTDHRAPNLHAAAADVLRRGVPLLPADHPNRDALAGVRAAALVQVILATGDLSQLGEAAEEAGRAVRLCPPGDPNLMSYLMLHADVQRLRYSSEPALDTLDALRDSVRQALDHSPAGHPGRDSLLHNLGLVHQERFRMTGDRADLDSAAHHLRLVAAQTRDPAVRDAARTTLAEVNRMRGPAPEVPPGLTFVGTSADAPRGPLDPAGDDPVEILRHSGVVQDRMLAYQRTGDLNKLDQACEYGRTLLAGLPEENRWMVGSGLGSALILRYEERGRPEDLDEAVDLLRAAAARPAWDPDHVAGDVANLASALGHRFRRDHHGADLDEAIALARRAVEAEPPHRPEWARYAATLGSLLVDRFQHTGRRFDLDESIEIGRSVLAAARAPEAEQHARANLGNRLRIRFLVTGERADLDAAIGLLREAIGSGDPWSRVNLGLALGDRGGDDLTEAVELLRSVLATTGAQSILQETARLGLAEALAALGRVGEAVTTLDGQLPVQPVERLDALELLGRLHARLATDGSGDWSRAAAAYARAVAQLPVTVAGGLPAGDRNRLISRWWDLACDAAASAIAAGTPERAVELLDNGRSLWWGQVLDARADPVPATAFADLADVAADGPVVMVNVSRHRCDALVLTGDGVRVVPLPGLTADDADRRTRRYLDAAGRAGVGGTSAGPREQVLLAYLEWLWDVVAGPILDAVPVPGGSRLWWCPTGPLALAPLHAAGYHDPEDEPAGRSVLDRVVSSTTPTLRALRHARRTQPRTTGRRLVVAVPEKPSYVAGLSGLPATVREAELVRARFSDATVLIGPAATRTRVIELLADHDRVHLACHGEPGSRTGEAALYLADAPLTVTDLAGLDLRDARLAVLTACHTAIGDTDRPDEAGHLAAALQVAGFRQVVSTLWAIGDDTAVEVTDRLYRDLAPAHAVHAAIRELRRRHPYQPGRWAPFVHLGA
ncbi:CHAT domain-containing protein [Actinoplanes sp. NPDC020271]|uniref:CHAT domain-containing protein n=1 Tax=Actinoplanes sp. NPDC020271 TaxID=3363896 RepID=UPI0037AE452A